MSSDDNDGIWYPSVDDILVIHDDIVDEDPDASRGVQDPDRIEFAISFVRDGICGEVPETIHEKAFHLMRLLASNHWFADGNKRTALNTTELFYIVNGYELEYGEDLRSMLKLFSVRESLIDRENGPTYLRDQTTRSRITKDGSSMSLLLMGILAFTDEDAYPDEFLVVDEESPRESLGLTREYDGNVNSDDDGSTDHDGG